MSYRHLTTEERVQLGLLKELGWSTREIAKKLERHHSSRISSSNLNIGVSPVNSFISFKPNKK
jgi:hypothetical protein